MNAETLKSQAQAAYNGATVVVLAVYVIGFLILSLHHAYFGIPQVSLLRGRIISSGLLFCVLAAIPVIETVRIVDLPGVWTTSDQHRFGPIVQNLPWLFMAITIESVVLRLALMENQFGPGTHYMWVFGIVPAIALVSLPTRSSRSGLFYLRLAALIILVGFCIFRTRDVELQSLIGWFLSCAFITIQAYRPLRNRQNLLKVNLVQTLLGAIGIVAMFVFLVYRKIPTSLGGAALVPVTVSFADAKQPPIGNTPILKMWLLDETDAGFYLLQRKDVNKAVFIPRNTVNAINFGD